MRIEYLPAYSPDFNPIELAFSFLKGVLRREGQITREGAGDDYLVYEQLYRHVFCISSEKCRAFFHHSGYL